MNKSKKRRRTFDTMMLSEAKKRCVNHFQIFETLNLIPDHFTSSAD
jgi:hypothetical protein